LARQEFCPVENLVCGRDRQLQTRKEISINPTQIKNRAASPMISPVANEVIEIQNGTEPISLSTEHED